MSTRRFGWLLAIPLLAAGVSASELPPDAVKLTEAYEQTTADLRAGLDEKADMLITKVMADLLMQQETLTKAGKLDDAISVRNRLRQAEGAVDPSTKRDVLCEKTDDLPTAARNLIRTFDLELSNQQSKLNIALEDQRKKFVKGLTDLQANYTKAGKLDEAVAIRDRLQTEVPTKTVAKSPVPTTAKRPVRKSQTPPPKPTANSLTAFQTRFREDVADLDRQNNANAESQLPKLLTALKAAQMQLTKAGNLDQAVIVRDLILVITNEKLSLPQKLDAISKGNDKLAPDTKQVVSEFNREVAEFRRQIDEEKKKLTEVYAEALVPLVTSTLSTGDLEASTSIMGVYHQFRYSPTSFVRGAPPVLPDAQPVISETLERCSKLVQVAEQGEAKARKELIEKLKKLPETPVNKQVIDELSSEKATGVPGGLLVAKNSGLAKEAVAITSAYRKTVLSLRRKVYAECAPLIQKAKTDLMPVVRRTAQAHDFEAALNMLTTVSTLRPQFTETAIKYAPALGFPTTWSATLVDVTENYGLVKSETGHRSEQWLPLAQVVIPGSPDDIQQARRDLFGQQQKQVIHQPGAAVGAKADLQFGDELLNQFASTWQPVLVVGVNATTVRIQAVSHGGHRVETVERSVLRFPSTAVQNAN